MTDSQSHTRTHLLVAASGGFRLLQIILKFGSGGIRQIFAITTISAVLPAVLVIVCSAEGTLYLRSANSGRGLLEHYGTWSLALACPLILWMLVNILCKTEVSIFQLSKSAASEQPVRDLVTAGKRLEEILKCRKIEHRVCFYLLVSVGIFATVANFQNTRQTMAIYGHDVWDSSTHLLGFIFGKLFVGTMFIYVFPVTVYVASTVWFAILSLSSKVANVETINVSPYHPDKCGGFRHLGKATIAISQLSLPFVVAVIGHYYTHQSFYESLLLASVTVFAATVALLYLPFVELHKHLKSAKTKLLEELQYFLDAETKQFVRESNDRRSPNGSSHQLSILACTTLYGQAEKLNTWPYIASDHAKWLSILISPIIAYILKRTLGG